jgi:8-oxo-dGTP pyrophosphatase MutT (NUDIX family)
MRYGISAGALILHDQRLLLVHHFEADKYDFWVPPGGRLEGAESIVECAQREALEETGLRVQPGQILYIEEFYEPGYHFCKFFFLCDLVDGNLTIKNKDFDEDFLIEARYFTKEELQELNVYPKILKDGFWEDIQLKEPVTKYLGLQILQTGE